MDRKLKIVFILPSMNMGGVSKMLISILNCIDKEKFDVSILLFEKRGELLIDIPKWVTIIEETRCKSRETFRKKISGKLNKFGLSKLFVLMKKIYHRHGHFFIPRDRCKDIVFYDVAIAFQDGMATWYTAKNINARHKLAVVHTDFELAQYDPSIEKRVYACFEKIYCTSHAARESFVQSLPEFSEYTKVLLPNIDRDFICKMAANSGEIIAELDAVKIATVARLSHEKGIDKAIYVLEKLLQSGYNAKWYFVGDGVERQKLENMAEKLGCRENAVFLGNIDNPYGVMATCDIYVQPSNYESFCITLAEARALGCAIVSSDFPSAHEQLGEHSGLIAGVTWESLYEGVKQMIDNPQLRHRLSEECTSSFQQEMYSENVLQRDLERFLADRGD